MRFISSLLIALAAFGSVIGYSWWQYQEQQRPATAVTVPSAAATAEGAYKLTLRPVERRTATLDALDQLQAEPCLRPAAYRLMRELAEVDGYRSAINVGLTFRERCGRDDEMTQLMMLAYVNLSEYEPALRMATDYIEANRADPSPRAWRAEVYAKQGNLEAAVADYRDSLSLFPDPGDVHPNSYWALANALDKAGRPCEGVVVMRSFVSFAPSERRSAQIGSLIADLGRRGNCAAEAGSGTADIRFRNNAGAIEVSAKVNGKTGRFIVDTGASALSVTRAFAQKAGLPLDGGEILMHAANGIMTGHASRAETTALGGAVARNVYAVVLPEGKSFAPGLDGLLGLSFLGNFDMRIAGNRLTLAPPETAAASRR